jgi:fructose-1,6-bisphosphatase/inositol monophosphatase family enzyme
MSLTRAQLGRVVELLVEAGERIIMPQFRRLAPDAVRAKNGPLDLVTHADEAAERLIGEGLRREFPGCLLVGEEAASADRGLLAGLETAELGFTIDPIDGTSNYVAGVPLFGSMVAATRYGEVVAAAIHDPVTRETLLALRGEGAWRLDDSGAESGIRTAEPVPLRRMTGSASWRYFPPAMRPRIMQGLTEVAQVWDFRCAAHVYRLVAMGHCHFVVFNRLLPWDHAPGWLLHREAGGYSALLDGRPYSVATVEGGLICTPDRETWLALRAALVGG